jgi:hypothetical protein
MRGTWSHAIACRDMASDLRSIRKGACQTSVPLFNSQIDVLIDLLESEHSKTSTALMVRFFERLP